MSSLDSVSARVLGSIASVDSTPNVEGRRPSSSPTPTEDIATILSKLPDSGAQDAVTLVMDLYETGERHYRAGMKAGALHVGSSASANR